MDMQQRLMNQLKQKRRMRQYQQDRDMLQSQQAMANQQANATTPMDTLGSVNDMRSGLGQLGKKMSSNDNQTVSNIGKNLYKYSGEEASDGIRNNVKGILDKALGKTPQTVNPNILNAGSIMDAGANVGSGIMGAGTTGINAGTGALTSSLASEGAGSALGSAIGAEALGTGATEGALGSALAAETGAGAGAGGALAAAGPIGAGLAAAYMIYNMIDSAKKAEDMKAMKLSEGEAKKSEAEVDKGINEAVNNISNNATVDNMNQLNQQMMIPNQNVQPDIANVPVNDSLSQDGITNPNLIQGNVTGGASNIYDTVEKLANPDDYEVTPLNAIPQAQPEVQPVKSNPIMDMINSAKTGIDNGVSGLQDGIRDFASGYQDNATHGWREGDFLGNKNVPEKVEQVDGALQAGTDKNNKSLMNRLGEVFGTASRVMTNPWTHAAIAGLISKNHGNNPLTVAKDAYEYGTRQAKANMYANKMNMNPTALGSYNANDYNAVTGADYRNKRVDLLYDKLLLDDANKKKDLSIKEKDTNSKIVYRKDVAANGATNAKANATKAANQGKHYNAVEKIQQQNADTNRGNLTLKEKKFIQKTQEDQINNGEAVWGYTPSGAKVLVPINKVGEFKRNGGKI